MSWHLHLATYCQAAFSYYSSKDVKACICSSTVATTHGCRMRIDFSQNLVLYPHVDHQGHLRHSNIAYINLMPHTLLPIDLLLCTYSANIEKHNEFHTQQRHPTFNRQSHSSWVNKPSLSSPQSHRPKSTLLRATHQKPKPLETRSN